MRINEKKLKQKKGFTLIELIIVIAIIAILAAIAIPNFLAIQRKARINADIATAKTIYDETAAAIAEGKLESIKLDLSHGMNGFGVRLTNPDMSDKNTKEILKFLNVKSLKPESVKDGEFYLGVMYDYKQDGSADIDKPIINVQVLDKDNKPAMDLYPKFVKYNN